MQQSKRILLWVLTLIVWIIVPVVGTVAIFIGIGIIQEQLFVPKEYIIWVVSPVINLIFIYELLLIGGLIFFWYRHFWKKRKPTTRSEKHSFFSKNKKSIISVFVVGNLVLLYTIITAVTVITNDKIIVHSFLSPQGKEYSYNEIVQIEAGVYGKRKVFQSSKGDFFYIIELADGKKVDLTMMGGGYEDSDSDDEVHEVFIIEELDKVFVKMQIPKSASMENYQYSTKMLDPIYTEAIKNALENNEKY